MGAYDDVISLAEWITDAKPILKDLETIQKKVVLEKPLKICLTTEHNIGKHIGEFQICMGMRRVWKNKDEEEIFTTDNELIYLVEVPEQERKIKDCEYWRPYSTMEMAAEEAERICQDYHLVLERSG